MGGGVQSVDDTSSMRCLAHVQTVKARLKTKSEAMQAYADWLYDRLAQSTKVGFLLHAANARKTVLIAEWEAAHKRLLAFKEATEEIQFTFRKLQKNLEVVEQKVKEMEALKSKPRQEIPDVDRFMALLADLKESCVGPQKPLAAVAAAGVSASSEPMDAADQDLDVGMMSTDVAAEVAIEAQPSDPVDEVDEPFDQVVAAAEQAEKEANRDGSALIITAAVAAEETSDGDHSA